MPTTTILVSPRQATTIRASLRTRYGELLDAGTDVTDEVRREELKELGALLGSVEVRCEDAQSGPLTGSRRLLRLVVYEVLYLRVAEVHDLCLHLWEGLVSPEDIRAATNELTDVLALLQAVEGGKPVR